MSENFEREEAAFRKALSGPVDEEGFRPIDPAEITGAATRRRRSRLFGPPGMAVAAAVVLVAAMGVAIPVMLGGGPANAPMSAPDSAADSSKSEVTASGQTRVPRSAGQSGAWRTVSQSPLEPRLNASGAWLNGRFYVFGGQVDPVCTSGATCSAVPRLLADGASYDPATGAWRPMAPAPAPLAGSRTVVAHGRIYAQVGVDTAAGVYVYDPESDDWRVVPRTPNAGTLVAAGDRLVSLAATGRHAVFDPEQQSWTQVSTDPLGSVEVREGVGRPGRLLVLGQAAKQDREASEQVVSAAELDLNTMTWRKRSDGEASAPGVVGAGVYAVLPGECSFDEGDLSACRSDPMGGVYNAKTGKWSDLSSPAPASEGLASEESLTVGSRVLVAGHLLDPKTRSWTRLPTPPRGNLTGQTVVASPTGILIFGGTDGSSPSSAGDYLPLQ